MAITILESAANLRQRRAEIEAVIDKLRAADGDWPMYSIAADEAMKAVEDSVCNAWMILGSIQRMSEAALKLQVRPNT